MFHGFLPAALHGHAVFPKVPNSGPQHTNEWPLCLTMWYRWVGHLLYMRKKRGSEASIKGVKSFLLLLHLLKYFIHIHDISKFYHSVLSLCQQCTLLPSTSVFDLGLPVLHDQCNITPLPSSVPLASRKYVFFTSQPCPSSSPTLLLQSFWCQKSGSSHG